MIRISKLSSSLNVSRKCMFIKSLSTSSSSVFDPTDTFETRHMGSHGKVKQKMLDYLGFKSLDELIDSTVPKQIRMNKKLNI